MPHCVGCGQTTHQIRRPTNAKMTSRSSHHLTCSQCNRFFCLKCVQELHGEMQRDRHNFHQDYDTFMNSLDSFLVEPHVTPHNYIGCCCMIRNKINALKHASVAATSVSPSPRKKIKTCNSITGGSFCLPQFRLLIASDEQCIDVFGLGKEEGIPPYWHAVMDQRHCENLESTTSKRPATTVPSTWSTERVFVRNTDLPHTMSGFRNKVCIAFCVMCFLWSNDFVVVTHICFKRNTILLWMFFVFLGCALLTLNCSKAATRF